MIGKGKEDASCVSISRGWFDDERLFIMQGKGEKTDYIDYSGYFD